jgi:hypothetical protein
MKNSGKHADELKALCKKLVKDRPARPELEPLVAIVRGTLSMDADDMLVEEAMEKITAEFVDLNELRVATELEVVDLLGEAHPKIDEKATIIRSTMHGIFDREQTLKFDRIQELKKNEIRQFFRDMETMPPFVEAFVSMHAFDIPAFPLDESTLDYLIDTDVVEEDVSLEEAQQFVESHIKADDMYGSYLAIRAKALTHERKKPRKEAAKKK